MRPFPDSASPTDADVLAERVEGLATWIQELDTRVRAAEVATGDERTAKELRKAVEALAKHDPKLEERLTNKVDVLADRLATLAGTVSTATAALAGKDGEIAGLRKEVALATGALADLRAEVRSATRPAELDELHRAVERLASERSSRGESKKLAALEDKITRLAQRFDTVSATVSTATAGLAGHEGDVTALARRLEEDTTRLDAALADLRTMADPALLRDLRSVVEAVSAQLSSFQQEARRDLVALGVDHETMSHRIGALDASVAATAERSAGHDAGIAALETRVVAASERSAVLDDGLGAVKAQLVAVVEQVADLEQRADDLSEARAALEGALERAAERDRDVADLETRLGGSTTRLAEVVEQVAELRTTLDGVSADADAELRALTSQFETGCAQVDSLVGDLRESLATMPDPEASSRLGWRLESLVEEVAVLRKEASRTASSSAGETAELRALVEEQSRRLEEGEAELAGLAQVREALGGVDDLARRVEAVEKGVANAARALTPVAGEGRLRVELRALELRIEHAEAAVREGRDAVLAKMEQIASLMESRLQHLEAEQASPSHGEDRDGQVIPIRSSEA